VSACQSGVCVEMYLDERLGSVGAMRSGFFYLCVWIGGDGVLVLILPVYYSVLAFGNMALLILTLVVSM
jgi:hypothetical protein